MKYKKINEKQLANYKKLDTPIHTESELYIVDNELYKVYNAGLGTHERKKNVIGLSEFFHPNCIFPKYGLKNERNIFCGIGIEYLEDYELLSFFLKHNYMPFGKRKELILQICSIIRYLQSNNISFTDIHTNNFMIKDNFIKAIDLDSSIMKKYLDTSQYTFRSNFSNTMLTIMCFQILCNYDFNHNDIHPTRRNKVIKMANEKQRKFLNRAFHRDNYQDVIDIEEYIDYFDENFIEESKLIMKL